MKKALILGMGTFFKLWDRQKTSGQSRYSMTLAVRESGSTGRKPAGKERTTGQEDACLHLPVPLCFCRKVFSGWKCKKVHRLLYHSLCTNLVPVAGLEPARDRSQGILSPRCLPFHHTGVPQQCTTCSLIRQARGGLRRGKNKKASGVPLAFCVRSISRSRRAGERSDGLS